MPTRTSLLFVSSPGLADRAIRSWDGDRMSHVGVRVGNAVFDATVRHGVARWDLEGWLQGREIIDDLPVFALSEATESAAIQALVSRIGQGYDLFEALGFLALRDLGSTGKPICSRLAVRTALHSFNAGRAAADRKWQP